MKYVIKKLLKKRIWKKIFYQRFSEPIHLNIISLYHKIIILFILLRYHIISQYIEIPQNTTAPGTVISAGMNDLSRYGHTGESLGSFISSKIRYWLCKYPNTLFIFNSLIDTNRPWLNHRIDILNKLMFDLSIELYDSNFWFFDSHASFVDVDDHFPIHSPTGNGIHISIRACQYISRIMADAIGALVSSSPVTARVWPLRSEFRQLIAGSRHPRYSGQGMFTNRHRLGLRY